MCALSYCMPDVMRGRARSNYTRPTLGRVRVRAGALVGGQSCGELRARLRLPRRGPLAYRHCRAAAARCCGQRGCRQLLRRLPHRPGDRVEAGAVLDEHIRQIAQRLKGVRVRRQQTEADLRGMKSGN